MPKLLKSLSFRKKSAYQVAQEEMKEKSKKKVKETEDADVTIVSMVEGKKTPKRKTKVAKVSKDENEEDKKEEPTNGETIPKRRRSSVAASPNGKESKRSKQRAETVSVTSESTKKSKRSSVKDDLVESPDVNGTKLSMDSSGFDKSVVSVGGSEHSPEVETFEDDGSESGIESNEGNVMTFVPFESAPSTPGTSVNAAPPGLLMYDSEQEADQYFKWLISPFGYRDFFNNVWERTTVYIQRQDKTYYGSELFSTKMFEETLENSYIEWGKNLNAARFVDDERETLNLEGRAYRHIVWKLYEEEGCSLQLINPQTFCPSVWKLCTRLQELFCSFVGANTYLTPAGTTGFAPHWDDIDAFILQLEGRKHWIVYEPKSPQEWYPRESSGNFKTEEMEGNKVVYEGWMETGDLLYIPRGFIHHGYTDEDHHSLHITVSANRKNTYADMIEKLLPNVVKEVIDSTPELRRSLPKKYLTCTGIAGADEAKHRKGKEELTKSLKLFSDTLTERLMEYTNCGADMMAKEFMKTAMPPVLNETEAVSSVTGQGLKWNSETNELDGQDELTLETRVKFIRKHGQRLIYETKDTAYLVNRMQNSRICEERESPDIDIKSELIEGVEFLLDTYPEYVPIADIELEDGDLKLELAYLLYNNGLLMRE